MKVKVIAGIREVNISDPLCGTWIEFVSLSFCVLSSYSFWMTPTGAEDGFFVSAVRWLERNCPSVPLEAPTAHRDRRTQKLAT